MKNYVVVNDYIFNESFVDQEKIIRSAFGAQPELLECFGSFGWEQKAPYSHRWGFSYPNGEKEIIQAIARCPEGYWKIEWVTITPDGEEIEMTSKYVRIE